MNSRSGLLFSEKELDALVSDPISRVRAEKRVHHITMFAECLRDLKSAINGILDILDSYQNKFDESFSGFILSYKDVKILIDRGTIINDDGCVHLDIEADFYIFTPEVGCTLSGIANKKSANDIGCLVHKCYHVSVPQPPEEIEEEWLGSSVKIGDRVMFTVEVCDFTGNLPYIQGKLIDSTPANVTPLMAEEVDSTIEPKKKKKRNKKKNKKKRHKESEESLAGAEYNLMTDSLQQEVTEPQQKKRPLENEWEANTEKKKKVENHKSDYHETPENEDLHFTQLSSEGIEYNIILEDLKDKYLNKTRGNSDPKSRKKNKKESKLHIDANKETASTEDLEYAHEINAHKVKKSHKKKQKKNEIMTEEIPEFFETLGLHKSSCKQLEESLISASSHDNCSASSALRSSIAALPGTSIQETDFDMTDVSPKTKRKKSKHNDVEPFDVQREAETTVSLQKSSVNSVPMNNLANNSDVKDLHRKERHDSFESHNRELLNFNNESYKSTTKGVSSLDQWLDSLTPIRCSGELKIVPCIDELLNRAKSELNVKSSKKHEKNKERKKTRSERGDLKSAHNVQSRKGTNHNDNLNLDHNVEFSIDPADFLAKYMSKFAKRDDDDTANESSSSEKNVTEGKEKNSACNSTSNMRYKSPFSFKKVGMYNYLDRKRKKLNKGRGDAMPVRMSLPVIRTRSFGLPQSFYDAISTRKSLPSYPSYSPNKAEGSVVDPLSLRSDSIECSQYFPTSPKKSNSEMKVKTVTTNEGSEVDPQSLRSDSIECSQYFPTSPKKSNSDPQSLRSDSIECSQYFPTSLKKSNSGKKAKKAVTINEGGTITTPGRCFIQTKVSTSSLSDIFSPAEKPVKSTKERTEPIVDFLSPKEKTPPKGILSQISSDAQLFTPLSASSNAIKRKNSMQQSEGNSPMNKHQFSPTSNDNSRVLNMSTKMSRASDGHGSNSEGDFSSLKIPDLDNVLRSLKSDMSRASDSHGSNSEGEFSERNSPMNKHQFSPTSNDDSRVLNMSTKMSRARDGHGSNSEGDFSSLKIPDLNNMLRSLKSDMSRASDGHGSNSEGEFSSLKIPDLNNVLRSLKSPSLGSKRATDSLLVEKKTVDECSTNLVKDTNVTEIKDKNKAKKKRKETRNKRKHDGGGEHREWKKKS